MKFTLSTGAAAVLSAALLSANPTAPLYAQAKGANNTKPYCRSSIAG